jgi:hypothetical protein
MSQLKITGQVKSISNAIVKSDKFRFVNLILTIDQKYDPDICIQFVNDNIDRLSDIQVGFHVDCYINIRSNEYKGAWYTNLNCWKIELNNEERPTDHSPHNEKEQHEMADDELPF